MPRVADARATATARSLAGSISRAPPTVEAKTSWACSRMPQCCWSTASTIATREESSPDVVRRGRSAGVGVTRACTSASSGRRPSIVTATQVPGTCWWWCSTNSPVGSVTAAMPSADRSKQPTSSTGPNRFFIARTIRNRELRSPSKWSTTSTRCSSTRGPAIEPSLVTWPTSTVVMLRVLATRISAAATSLTWVTPPGTPSTSPAPMVWIESTTSSVGPDLLDVGEHRAEVGLGGEVELVVHAAGAVGAQPDLRGRLLAGDVEGAALVARGLGGDLEQQRALADAGLAGEQDRGAGDQPAAEHPVELGHAAGAERESSTETWPIGTAGPVTGPAAARAVGAAGLGDRAPGLALAAAADPLGGLPAALGAAVRRGVGGFGMAGTLGHVADSVAATAARPARSAGYAVLDWNDQGGPR